MGEAEKYGAIAVRWTQDAQVIIITRIKSFEVEKKYIYSISYHRHLIFFFRYAAKLPVHPLSECVCVLYMCWLKNCWWNVLDGSKKLRLDMGIFQLWENRSVKWQYIRQYEKNWEDSKSKRFYTRSSSS